MTSHRLQDGDAEGDRTLVRAVVGGSADALGRLYDRHAGAVYGLALRVLTRPEDAEEVVQDVFTQVWRTADRYRADRATVAGWIVMLTRTRAIDRLRARRARPDHARGVDLASAPSAVAATRDPELSAVSSAEARRLRQALLGLPEVQRHLVELAFFEGLTHAELADRTSTPLGTVKTRLRSAMRALRGSLGEGEAVSGT